MAAARVSHKRSYDDFITPYASFGYSAHAGRNVETVVPEKMDVMEDLMPTNKRAKYAIHDDETAITSTPSTQATLAAKAVQSMPKLSSPEERTNPCKFCGLSRLSHLLSRFSSWPRNPFYLLKVHPIPAD